MVFVLLSASRALVSSPQRSRPRGRRTDDPAHTVYRRVPSDGCRRVPEGADGCCRNGCQQVPTGADRDRRGRRGPTRGPTGADGCRRLGGCRRARREMIASYGLAAKAFGICMTGSARKHQKAALELLTTHSKRKTRRAGCNPPLVCGGCPHARDARASDINFLP